MVIQNITQQPDAAKWYNPLSWGGNLNSQLAQTGDSNIGSGLINLSKKEVRMSEQNSFQTTDARDLSRTNIITNTDSRALTYTNAPTFVLNSAGASVEGANTSVAPSTVISPQTKKEQAVAQTSSQTSDQSAGLDLGKIALYLAIAGVVYLLLAGGKKGVSAAVKNSPVVKAVKKVTKKITKKVKK